MIRKTIVVVLSCFLGLLVVGHEHARGQPALARGADANILSPKLCFTLKIAGDWVPGEYSGSYVSPDGKQFVRVMPRDLKDLKSYKGETLIERQGASLERDYEKVFHQKLTGITLAPFASAVQGTWKWTAAPVRDKNREVPVAPRYFADLSPEGVIVIEIEGTPDDDQLARNILETLNRSTAQPCQLPKSLKELMKGIKDTPAPAKSPASAPIEESVPPRDFKNPALPWSIQYPANWQLDAADPRRVLITRPGPGDDTVCEIISVNVQFQSVDEFADFWLRQTAEHMNSQGGRVRRTDRQRISLPNGIEGIAVWSEISGGGRSRTVFVLADGVGYVIDCVTSVNSWEGFAPVFARIIGSFTLEKKP